MIEEMRISKSERNENEFLTWLFTQPIFSLLFGFPQPITWLKHDLLKWKANLTWGSELFHKASNMDSVAMETASYPLLGATGKFVFSSLVVSIG